MSFIVFHVGGPNTTDEYIGYGSNSIDECRKAFIAGARRSDADEHRGSWVLVESNGDVDSLTFSPLEEYEDQLEAHDRRNELRAENPLVVTGPSYYPPQIHAAALARDPGRTEAYQLRRKQRSHLTARLAYEDKAYTYPQIKDLMDRFGREAVNDDMYILSPAKFYIKYGI